jgi:hypothetical protein
MHTIAAVSLAVPAFTRTSVPQPVQGVQRTARESLRQRLEAVNKVARIFSMLERVFANGLLRFN